MARPKSKTPPAYCHAKDTGRAFVTLNGKRVYLGTYSEDPASESRRRYSVVIGEWETRGRQPAPSTKAVPAGPTVSVVIAAFWQHALTYYAACVRPDGKATGELDNYRLALKPVRRLYGRDEDYAANFGPLSLKTVRDEMVRLGWCRNVINRQVLRIKHVFRWAVGNELLDARVYEALRAVAGLREGKTQARESEPVKPVNENHAEAILDHLSPQIQGMMALHSITGMRPGELCIMRGVDIDTTSGKTWRYRPSQHKTKHRKLDRVVDLGPRAQEIISKFLKTDLQAFIFSPADAAEARRQLRREQRQTPLTCGNVPAEEFSQYDLPAVERAREPGDHYTPTSYRRAIARACAAAFPPPKRLERHRVQANGRKKRATRWETRAEWRKRLGVAAWAEMIAWEKKHRFHPHQLRHTAATRWRKEFGAEATLVLLGDRTTRMVDIYGEKDRATSAKIMEKIG